MLTLLPGRTVGDSYPWPRWTHSDQALDGIDRWLSGYHRAVADYVPPPEARWREGGTWRAGMIVGHGDPAPYNAVWNDEGLVGLIDWDNAGPSWPEDDLAWTAFAWTPLHARSVVTTEGFEELGRRRARLERMLAAYGWTGSADDVLSRVAARVRHQITTMRRTAAEGDPVYQWMIEQGRDRLLEQAIEELGDV
jgi:aminoglycoside phosphotransferase (APT) family kinase protein